jgi:hypothetical protein
MSTAGGTGGLAALVSLGTMLRATVASRSLASSLVLTRFFRYSPMWSRRSPCHRATRLCRCGHRGCAANPVSLGHRGLMYPTSSGFLVWVTSVRLLYGTCVTLRATGPRLAVVQDNQTVNAENEATGLLILPGDTLDERKTRVAAPWLEAAGWNTELIERRHHGDIRLTDLLCGLDRLEPRLVLSRHGYLHRLQFFGRLPEARVRAFAAVWLCARPASRRQEMDRSREKQRYPGST